MVGVVGILAVLSAIAGFLQFAPYWTPVDDFLEPVAEPLGHATNGQETFASIVAVALGLAGIAAAWLVYSAKKYPAPRPWAALEQKLYFDRLYDALFYRPSVATAKILYALVEGPLVGGSLTGIAAGTGRLPWTSARAGVCR